MADHTGIEWADATWNPIVGCSIVSPGCTNCYAMKMAGRLQAIAMGDRANNIVGSSHYIGTTKASAAGAVWTGKLALAPDHILTQPLRWRRPRRIFVNSMGDLFHEDAPDAWIDRVFAVMALAPQHTYMVLTKRSARMREYISGKKFSVPVLGGMPLERVHFEAQNDGEPWDTLKRYGNLYSLYCSVPWPLPNVWLGVSTEDQRRANERVPDLLATPAAIRFISAEPLLGPLNLIGLRLYNPTGEPWIDALRGLVTRGDYLARSPSESSFNTRTRIPGELPRIDLVIAGGESGPKARPMHPNWARFLRDQCAAAGTAFFFKQWGEWASVYDRDRDDPDWRNVPRPGDWDRKRFLNLAGGQGFHGEKLNMMRRVGKRHAGRLLDGVEHNAMPEVRP